MKLESIEKYQEIFKKDPNSQVFAALSDAYREMGMLPEAERTARHGVERHPTYVSGFVALGRVLVAVGKWAEAEVALMRAATLAPENILAYQLLGQVYLQQKRPKEALKTFKLVLFLNPQSEKARKAVEKLESLTADEYETEVFEMKKLGVDPGETPPDHANDPSRLDSAAAASLVEKSLERTLSLIDAYIVRNEIVRAQTLLNQAKRDFIRDEGALKKLESRWELLTESLPYEEATPLSPDMKREKYILDQKLRRLQALLQRIKQGPAAPSNN